MNQRPNNFANRCPLTLPPAAVRARRAGSAAAASSREARQINPGSLRHSCVLRLVAATQPRSGDCAQMRRSAH